ncbi:DMT family transporter [Treponema pedis]|uniref:DMT family transporter n=1 Tax=Treponema pedis TaxID=409322 RepID=UPI001980C4E9|nr:DMT family transporter [Treponema pedis]QSI05496.1 DMT family transporter [Treponema pedis]
MNSKISILSRLALLVTAIVWGSSLVVVSSSSDFFKPNFLLAIRFSIACILLCIIFFKKLKTINKSYLVNGFIVGFALFIAYSSQTFGVTAAGGLPGRSAFLSASYCVIVPFLSWAINKMRPDKFNVIAALLCITGIGITSFKDLAASSSSITSGDFYALLSGLLFASHIVAVTRFSKRKEPVLMTIIQFGAAAVFSWITTFIFEDNGKTVWNTSSVSAILYLSIMCTTLALLLQNIGQKYTEPSTAAIILGLESVFGIIFSIIFYGEKIDFYSVTGFILIFAAIIISETKLEFLKKKNFVHG